MNCQMCFNLADKVVIGGARLSKGLALEAIKLGIKVYAGYGLYETCPVLTLAHLKPSMLGAFVS